MMEFLVLKERLKSFYGKYDIYVNPFIKFIYGAAIFFMMNQNIGFMEKLNSPVIALVLALICSILPYGAISCLAAVVMLLHLYGLSFEIALICFVFILVISVLYFSFQPGDSYLVVLTPMLFVLKIPYLIPLLVGLSGTLMAIIPVSCGVFIYFMLTYVKQNAGVVTSEASLDITQKYAQLMKSMVSDKMMLIMIAAFAAAICVVYIIRRLSIDYAWIIAIAAGTITQLIVIFIGDMMVDVTVSIGQILFGILVSVLIAGIYDLFVFSVDYTRTEYTQFEDDDYYYYVKAVPKMTVSAPDVRVQKINSRKPRTR